MSVITIASGSNLAISTPYPNGTVIDFSGTSGTLILETTQITTPFNITTAQSNGTVQLVSDTIGAALMNFAPNSNQYFSGADSIVVENVQTVFADLDFAGTAATDLTGFGNFVSSASDGGNFYLVAPNGSITSAAGTNITLTQSLVPVLDDIVQGIFANEASLSNANLLLSFDKRTNPNSNNPFIDAVITSTDAVVNPCFCAGTRILTPGGEVAVERLAAGDDVITMAGMEQKIIWIGTRQIDINRHRRPESVRPVLIEPDALADGVPSRELRVSPDHALFLDGMLVPAKALLNGTSIYQDRAAMNVTYYHIELPQHDVLFAEGTPAETYLDCGQRGVFDNTAEPVILHPDFMQSRRQAEGCAPLCFDGEALAPLRARLAARLVARHPARYSA
jgi:hypothetical protein